MTGSTPRTPRERRPDGPGSVGPRVSQEIVSLYARVFRRGPPKAKTVYRGDFVLVLLRDAFTRSDELLVEAGRFQEVREQRQALRDVVEPELREIVERCTGRAVTGFFGQIDPHGTIALVFLLTDPLVRTRSRRTR